MVEAIVILYLIGVILASILTSKLTKEMYPNEDSSTLIIIMSVLSWITILIWLLGNDERGEADG